MRSFASLELPSSILVARAVKIFEDFGRKFDEKSRGFAKCSSLGKNPLVAGCSPA